MRGMGAMMAIVVIETSAGTTEVPGVATRRTNVVRATVVASDRCLAATGE
jgi:hypothetical protein